MARTAAEFTPTQLRMLEVLGDGLPHTKDELESCFEDVEFGDNLLSVHLTLLRKKLRAKGQEVVCEYKQRRLCYRHVRLIRPEQV